MKQRFSAGSAIVLAIASTLLAFSAQKPPSTKTDDDFFKKWLDEDAVYIITKDELAAAKRLKTAEEKDSFIRTFWERRDPTPGTPENEYRDEHYRRIAVADEKYTTSTDGWRTDRGKMYIRFGEPDSVDRNDSPGSTTMRSGESHMIVRFETWEYRNIPGIGYVKMTFVDRKMNGNYELTLNPADKLAKFGNEDLALVASNPNNLTTLTETPDSSDWSNRINQYIAVNHPPEIRFKDLKAMVHVKLSYNVLPFSVRFDTLRGPGEKSVIPLTFEFDPSGVRFQDGPDGRRAQVNVYGAVTDISGRVAYEFEDAVSLNDATYFQRFIALDPGRYKLSAVVKDVGSGNAGTREQVIVVSRRQQKLSTSSLMLADLLIAADPGEKLLDNFVISRFRVRPLVKPEISRSAPLSIYQEVYGFATDPKTNQPEISAVVQVFKKGDAAAVLTVPATSEELSTRFIDRLLIAKTLRLPELSTGEYIVRLAVSDKLKNETSVSEAPLTLKD